MADKLFDYAYYACLAKRIRQNDGNAFTELYQYTCKDIYRYICYILKDEHLAQDALQEIYISVYKNIACLKEDRLLYSWMRQITYHVCCDFLRKPASTHENTTDFTKDIQMKNLADTKDYFQPVHDQDFSDKLSSALEHLPVQVQQAFLLRFTYELKLEEISDFLNCSLSTVKRYIKSARKHLQKELSVYQKTF